MIRGLMDIWMLVIYIHAWIYCWANIGLDNLNAGVQSQSLKNVYWMKCLWFVQWYFTQHTAIR